MRLFGSKKALPNEEAIEKHTASAKAYLAENYVAPPKPVSTGTDSGIRYSVREAEVRWRLRDDYSSAALDSYLREPLKKRDVTRIRKTLEDNADLTFVEKLMVIIRDKDIKDSEVYKPAGIDRRLFSKIMSDVSYSPSKDTALAIALSLHLKQEEAADLLKRAGFTFSHSNKRDLIIEHFFRERFYDLPEINAVLENMGERIIGR